MDSDYIKLMYNQIDELIIAQKNAFNSGDIKETECNDNFNEVMEIQIKINKIFSIIMEAKERAYKQVCYNQLMIQNSIKDGRKSLTMKDYVFLTINPPDQLDHNRLVQAVTDFTGLNCVEWAHYVFEQRGKEQGDYHGFHTHILFKRDRRPSEVEKAIYRIFMPLVPDKQKIKWWSQDDMKEIYNAYAYILGKKKNKDKAPAIENNSTMRKNYGLKEIYTVGEPPLLVGGSPTGTKLSLKLLKDISQPSGISNNNATISNTQVLPQTD